VETHLKCRRCDKEYEIGKYFGGCPDCANRGEQGTLEVTYDYDAVATRLGPPFWGMAWDSMWQYAPLLPVADTSNIVSLGEGNTPLILSRVIAEMVGLRYLFFKNESVNPTWSHKDRLHTVATSMAKVLGYSKTVASSTGNHGAAAAAYASAAGMDCVIFCPDQTSKLLLDLISNLGARVLITDWEGRSALIPEMVGRGHWYPALFFGADYVDCPNPYGVEGYKTIAFEVHRQLGGIPDKIFLAAAAGDTLYGAWKGFGEMKRLGASKKLPRVYGCQPESAHSLKVSLDKKLDHVVTMEEPKSIATSTMESTAGVHALEAIRESKGGAVAVSDDQIREAMELLGKEGLCVEPSSAVSVAAVIQLARQGKINPGEKVVCVVTSAGIKWPDALATTAPQPTRVEMSIPGLNAVLDKWGLGG
jgi:threonine synthase